MGRESSSMPSAMLEQEAQTFGFRDRAFPVSGITSPQQTQILDFMGFGGAFDARWM
jgi:hypothetical protein